MSSAEDEGEVEKLSAYGANESLGEGVRPRSADRSLDHANAL
jgi:hypothetical protein